MKDTEKLSLKTSHFFHVVSNIRPIVWICSYVAVMPIFAFIYWALPDTQFRIPENASTDYWSWLYYSVVTETTLGFGDYTPAHVWAQVFTALEVMLGLVLIGFFLNAVGSMKSEIDVESEVEKQKLAHAAIQRRKLTLSIPSLLNSIKTFLSYCYAATTPVSRREPSGKYNPDFKFSDLKDLFKPVSLPSDPTQIPAVERLIRSASQTSLALDSLQNHVDLTLWPEIMENCFAFVAEFQMFSSADILADNHYASSSPDSYNALSAKRLETEIAGFNGEPGNDIPPELKNIGELYYFIKNEAAKAILLEKQLSEVASR